MQSLYRIIKEPSVISQGSKAIVTQYLRTQSDSVEVGLPINSDIKEEQSMVSDILDKARTQSEAIINEAILKAQQIQKEAYEQGYNAGYAEGEQRGCEDAYVQNLPAAREQADAILQNADNILKSSKLEYENYIAEKKDEILKLTLNIAAHILKREVENTEGIDEMIIDAIEGSRNTETIIIKTHSLYVENIKGKISDWKERLALRAEVFVIADAAMEKGCAIIEKNNGKIKVSIDDALENIRKVVQC
ncbi:MAG: flagellar assembly protein FliH [Bacillota bacterium]|nr:flagellar assembly protein FliH [Bacillota bacterium]